MSSPVIQFKRGQAANIGIASFKAGEPGFTTDKYDFYIGVDGTAANQQFFGSSRYWEREDGSSAAQLKFVDKDGSNSINFQAPNTLAGIGTWILPDYAAGSANQFLKVSSVSGNQRTLDWDTVTTTFDIAADSGTNDEVSTGSTITFAGTANEIETTVTNNQIQIGLPNNVVVGGGLTATTFTLAGVAVTAILDEDGLTSDRDNALATQQSIKAYVDSQVTAQDLDVAGDSGTGAVDLDSQSLTIAGTTDEIETSASNQTITVGLPDAVTVTTSVTTPTVKATNVQANDGTTAITITDSTGAVSCNQNLTVSGNLYVNGSTTQVNTTTLNVKDSLVDFGLIDTGGGVLGPPTSDLNKDIGVLFNYYSGSAKKASVYWDDSTSRIVVSADVSESLGVLTNNTSGALEIASLYINGCTGSAVEVIKCTNSEIFIENATIDGGSF